MHHCVVLCLDRANRDARGAAATGGSILVSLRITRLRSGLHAIAKFGDRRRHTLIQICQRDAGQWIRPAARCIELGFRIARDAKFLFGFAVPRLQIVVRDRPIDAHPKRRAQPKIVGHKPERGAEPVPRRAANLSQVGSLELVWTILQVVDIRFVARRVRRVRRVRVRTFRNFDQRSSKLRECRGS
jgi:hypothetical protein